MLSKLKIIREVKKETLANKKMLETLCIDKEIFDVQIQVKGPLYKGMEYKEIWNSNRQVNQQPMRRHNLEALHMVGWV